MVLRLSPSRQTKSLRLYVCVGLELLPLLLPSSVRVRVWVVPTNSKTQVEVVSFLTTVDPTQEANVSGVHTRVQTL